MQVTSPGVLLQLFVDHVNYEIFLLLKIKLFNLNNLVFLVTNQVLTNILHVISLIIPIGMLVIGIIYKDQCKIHQQIPIWLIVAGIGGITNGLLNLTSNAISCIRFRITGETAGQRLISCITTILGLFLFIWLVLGSVWVYRIHKMVVFNDFDAANYCNKICYSFSFWSITVTWVFLFIACMCLCGLFSVAVGKICDSFIKR